MPSTEDKIFFFFVYDEKKEKVISINDDELKTPLDFPEFFRKYLSFDMLGISEPSFSMETLLQIMKDENIHELPFGQNENKHIHVQFNHMEDTVEVLFHSHYNKENINKDYDFLTEVYSRSYLSRYLKGRLSQDGVENDRLIMIDLDNFKRINDTYGHIMGDLCLKAITASLKSIFNGMMLGRYGGDEFIVYLNAPTKEELYTLLQKVLSIRYTYGKNSAVDKPVTCSCGITSPFGQRRDPLLLIEEADDALYECKKNGKNIAKVFEDKDFIYNESAKKKKTPKKIRKEKTNLLLQEEIKVKKRKFFLLLSIFLVAFLLIVALIDLSFNSMTDTETVSIAENLMSEKAKSTSNLAKEKTNYIIDSLQQATTVIDRFQYSGDGTSYYKDILSIMKDSVNISHPAILFDSGELYLDENNTYPMGSSKLAESLIINKETCVYKMSFFNLGEQIAFGYPTDITFVNASEGTIKISGLVSYFSPEELASSISFDDLSQGSYLSILDTKGNKIVSSSKDIEGNIFKDYSNIINCLDDLDYTKEKDEIDHYLSDGEEHLGYFTFGKTKMYIYTSKLGISDWVSFVMVPYETIYQNFSRLVSFSVVLIDVLSITFAVVIVAAFVFVNHVRSKAFLQTCIDPLTDFINTRRFFKDGATILATRNASYSIVYFYIQHFRLLESQFGTERAEKILADIAHFLSLRIQDEELITHDENDHFLMLLKGDRKEVENRLVEIKNSFNNLTFSAGKIRFQIHLGVYPIKDKSAPLWQDIDRARTAAMALSNLEDEISIHFFDEKMQEDFELTNYIEQSQELALQANRFRVFYQGKYDLHKNRFSACEALVRWKDNTKGYINTQTFVDVFERNGFIVKLDLFIFKKVLSDIKESMKEGREILPVSVNLSRIHFYDPDFFLNFENAIKESGVDPKYIEFEITEGVILNEKMDLTHVIEQIHQIGSKVSIDDFGSGFSNLSMINHIDFDILKMDKRLLQGKNGFDENSRQILKTVVKMCKNLNKTVLCEGVETKEEVDYLREIGCDLIQGYYYSKPSEKNDFLNLVDKTND